MAEFQSVFRTGYVYEGISHFEGRKPGSSLTLKKEFTDLWADDFLTPEELIVMDLEDHFMDRLYDVRTMQHDFGKILGAKWWRIEGQIEDEKAICAAIQFRPANNRLTIILPCASEILYPETTLSANDQRVGLLDDYAQIFKYTKQGIAAGKHVAQPRKKPPSIQQLLDL